MFYNTVFDTLTVAYEFVFKGQKTKELIVLSCLFLYGLILAHDFCLHPDLSGNRGIYKFFLHRESNLLQRSEIQEPVNILLVSHTVELVHPERVFS